MNIGGIERPIKFGINQTDMFCELRGIKLKDYYALLAGFETGNYMYGDIRDLVWSALKDGARQQGEEFDLSKYDVGDLMDADPAKYIAETLEALVGSLPKPTQNGSTKKKAKGKTYPLVK